MNDLIIIAILLFMILILMRKRRELINNPDPGQFKQQQPTNKSVTNDELDRVLMLMQISGSITPIERNRIYIKTIPFTRG